MISKKRFIVILGCSCLALSILGGCDSKKATHNSGAIEEETEFAALDVEYTENEDGTYTCRDIVFQHKMEVSGIEGEMESTFVILTNNKDVSFDTVSKSLSSSEMNEGEPEFVILGWLIK